jgi:ABC-type branched-subunit amino acid transport system substrate-binding protein
MYASLAAKPMVSPGSTSVESVDKSQFPFLLRSISSDSAQVKFMAVALSKLGIDNVAVLVTDDELGRGLLPRLVEYYSAAGITLRASVSYTPAGDDPSSSDLAKTRRSLDLALGTVKLSGARVVVSHSLTVDAQHLAAAAADAGLTADGRGADGRVLWFMSQAALDPASYPDFGGHLLHVGDAPAGENPARADFMDAWARDTTVYDEAVHGPYDPATFSPLFDHDDVFFDTDYAPVGDGKPDTWGMYV